MCNYCPSLTSLTLADSVITIGNGAFSYTPKLSCIFWAGPVGISIGRNSVSAKAICATDQSAQQQGNLRPTLQPTILTSSPTPSPTISQNPTLSPSVSTIYHILFHSLIIFILSQSNTDNIFILMLTLILMLMLMLMPMPMLSITNI